MSFDVAATFAEAQAKYQSGALDDAADLYQKVLEREPSHADALHMLGLVAYQVGQVDAAAALIQQAVTVRQPFADAEANLGTVLMALGRLDEALEALKMAVAHAPDNAAMHFNLGNVHSERQDWPAAKPAYETAVSLDPKQPQAWCQLGLALRQLDDVHGAQNAYEKALGLEPKHSQALYNLANIHRDAGHLGEAEMLLRRAIDARKDYAKAWNSLGTLLGDMGRSDEALDAFDQAATYAPESIAYASNRLCGLHYIPGITNARLAEAHTEWYWLHIATTVEESAPTETDPDPNRTLKIGFVSPDFGVHPVGYLTAPLFDHLDPTQIETTVFSTRPEEYEDNVSRRIRNACGSWHTVEALDDATLVETIKENSIDILFDMSGQTAGHRLMVFAHKPSPIQISWAGYVGTTGLPAMDYVLGDNTQFPEDAADHYTETPLALPDGYICYAASEDAPAVGPLPAQRAGYITFGCLNNPAKLNDDVTQVFADVLKEVPKSRLLFRFRGLDDAAASAPITAKFKKLGIDPQRLTFEGRAPHSEFLNTYNRIDIALDTFPYSGGLTTCEALWMGVPTVALLGETFAGRHAATHLRTAGYADLVSETHDEMIKKAINLTNNLDDLSTIRAGMRGQVAASPLCDGPRFAEAFTAEMRSVWQKWCTQD